MMLILQKTNQLIFILVANVKIGTIYHLKVNIRDTGDVIWSDESANARADAAVI